MSPNFSQINYHEILDELNNTSDWLQRIRLDVSNSRFSKILQYMEIICEHHQKKEVDTLIQNYDNEILSYATLESGAFLEIHKAFSTLKDHQIPRSKLKEILQGPFLPRHEDPKEQNIHARNTLFELQIAAKFKNAGIDVIRFDDVSFLFKGHKFNAQCKRIHSSKMIGENVEKAIDQISRKIGEDKNMKGIICLSINKLTDTDDKFLKVKTVDGIAHEMTRITSKFIERHYQYWRNTTTIGILACFIYFQAAAIIEETNLLTRCQQLQISLPENLQGAEYSTIEQIAELLRSP